MDGISSVMSLPKDMQRCHSWPPPNPPASRNQNLGKRNSEVLQALNISTQLLSWKDVIQTPLTVMSYIRPPYTHSLGPAMRQYGKRDGVHVYHTRQQAHHHSIRHQYPAASIQTRTWRRLYGKSTALR